MIIVSDTTPLRYLIELEAADILLTLFGQVIIPQRVFSELQDFGTPQIVRDWMQASPDWLIVRQADLSLFTPQVKIEDGEREAIALALALGADALLCDDGKAIKEAARLRLPVIRLFSVLDKAAAAGLLDLAEAVVRLRRTTFHLPPDELVDTLLERDRQRRGTQAD